MQSFYASCEAASRPEFALDRHEYDDSTDPALVVSGDPQLRSGIILAATPTAKKAGIENAMRLGEALQRCPKTFISVRRLPLSYWNCWMRSVEEQGLQDRKAGVWGSG
ncbi:hypothetical protein [Effusibacillus consociatus]|uniref:UmuC domain-containing protein n=1 Tax=Effusibacillus consociatus TaxID=1117041 RepID=A0ABV9PY33_9BACL